MLCDRSADYVAPSRACTISNRVDVGSPNGEGKACHPICGEAARANSNADSVATEGERLRSGQWRQIGFNRKL
ncbi:hypothetical protein D3C85_722480 [compost metagenome]